MNKLREKKAPEEIKPELPGKPATKGNKIFRSVGSVFSGNFLTQAGTVKQFPFVLFLAFLAICYISNGYYAEQKIRELNRITIDLKELRSEYITTKSDLVFISKQSEVAKAAAPLGIKESTVPPQKITITNKPPLPDKD